MLPAFNTFRELSMLFPLAYSAEDFVETVRAFDADDVRPETMIGETATLPLPRKGEPASLAPSPHFDSSAGLQVLLQEGGDTAVPLPRTAPPLRRIGWVLAYLAAAAGAVAIALK